MTASIEIQFGNTDSFMKQSSAQVSDTLSHLLYSTQYELIHDLEISMIWMNDPKYLISDIAAYFQKRDTVSALMNLLEKFSRLDSITIRLSTSGRHEGLRDKFDAFKALHIVPGFSHFQRNSLGTIIRVFDGVGGGVSGGAGGEGKSLGEFRGSLRYYEGWGRCRMMMNMRGR